MKLGTLLTLVVGVVACSATPDPSDPPNRVETLGRACLEDDEPTCMDAAEHLASQPVTPERTARLAALYYRACLRGRALGCAQAAELYARGDVPPPDRHRARAMFEHVCKSRFPFDPGACAAGALHGRACEGGVGASCAALAELHASGRLGKRQPQVAQRLLGRACSRGHTTSCAKVAVGIADRDPAAAAKLFAMGCQAGEAQQCVELASLIRRGVGMKRDLARVRGLLERACELKHGGGCRALGDMWRKGVGGGLSKANAFQRYTEGCDLDDADACLALARGHASAAFGEADMALYYELAGKAAKLYGPRCDAGDAHACHVLGGLHREGGGVRPDRSLGLSLQKRACEAGQGPACIAWLQRGPHRVSIKTQPKMAQAVADACRRGDGAACFAVGWIGRGDLESAGVEPPMHVFARGCGVGHAPSCNARGIVQFPPGAAGFAALRDACELGYAPGCHHLAIAKEMQSDVEADEQAVTAYARGCALDWPASCTRLGMMRRQGHVTPGAMSARAAFKKGCAGGDATGCFELGLLMGGQAGGDAKMGAQLLERACKKGHAASCAELGVRQLAAGAEGREAALSRLRSACDAGGHRACIVLAGELGEGQSEDKDVLLGKAIEGASGACDDGLAVCGGDVASRQVSRRWESYQGLPAHLIGHLPACGIALERACVVARDALVLRCESSRLTCFEAGKEIRRLSAAGLSIGVTDAEKVERIAFDHAKEACRKGDARGCNELAAAHRDGRGTKADAKQAERFQKRACQLDAKHCAK